MGLMDEVQEQVATRGSTCSVCVLMAGLPDDEREEYEKVFASTAPGTAIERALEQRGQKVGKGSVQRHRRGTCVPR